MKNKKESKPQEVVRETITNFRIPETKTQRFFSVVALPRESNDHFQSYQIEIIELRGSEIINRYMHDKPDAKQIVMAKLELINDPDNQEYAQHFKPVPAAV